MHRTRVAAGLFCVAAFLTLALIVQLVRVNSTAKVIETTRGDATIFLEVANPIVFFDCAKLRWAVDHIQAVKLNSSSVVGQGEKTLCSDQIDLRVKFQDGASQTYSIERELVTDSLFRRAQMALIVGLLSLAVVFTGLPDTILRVAGAQRTVRAVISRLPARDDRHASAANARLFMAAMVGVLLIGVAIRAANVTKPLRSDESTTYLFYVSQPLSVGLSDYSSTNNHPLNTLLVHLSVGLFGNNLLALRLPACLAGILVVAAAYAVGRRFFNPVTGLLAAALTASAPWMISYSDDARGYIISTLFFLLLLLVALSLRRRRRLGTWLLFALVGVAGFYTVLTTVYGIGVVITWLGLSILIEKRGRERILWLRDLGLAVILMMVTTGLLYLPLSLYVRAHDLSQLDITSFGRFDPRDFLPRYTRIAGEVWNGWNTPFLALSILLGLGCLVAAIAHSRLSRGRVSLLAASVLCLVPLVFVQMATTYPRNWVHLQPLYYVLGAAGLVYLCRWIAPRLIGSHPGRFALVVLLLTAGLTLDVFQTRSNYSINQVVRDLSAREALQRIRTDMRPGDTVLCTWFCVAYMVYSRWDNVPMRAAQPDAAIFARPFIVSVQPGQRLYLVTRDDSPRAPDDIPDVLNKFKISADGLMPDIVLADLSDSVVYRLQFSQPVTFSAYADING